jgi:hypothetical protein
MPGLSKELAILKHLHALSTDAAPPGDSLPKEQRDAGFRAFGIDPRKTGADLKARVDKMIAHSRLESAREARVAAQSAQQCNRQELAKGGGGLRQRVDELLKRLALNQPEIAAVYCRKFEQSTETDLESMKEDLLLLEQLEQDGGHDTDRGS